MVSESLNIGVWDLMNIPEQYLDVQLTLEAKYPRGSLKYTTNALRDEKLEFVGPTVAWANVLSGKAAREFYGRMTKGLKKRT
jgi:hypothetical protein